MRLDKFGAGLAGAMVVLATVAPAALAKHHDSMVEDRDEYCEAQVKRDAYSFKHKYPGLDLDDVYSYNTYELKDTHEYYRVYDNPEAFKEAQRIKGSYKSCLGG